jgi:hypothetical protein
VWAGFIWLRTGPSGKLLNLQVPQNAGNFLTSWRPVSFSRMTTLRGGSKTFRIAAVKTFHNAKMFHMYCLGLETIQCKAILRMFAVTIMPQVKVLIMYMVLAAFGNSIEAHLQGCGYLLTVR